MKSQIVYSFLAFLISTVPVQGFPAPGIKSANQQNPVEAFRKLSHPSSPKQVHPQLIKQGARKVRQQCPRDPPLLNAKLISQQAPKSDPQQDSKQDYQMLVPQQFPIYPVPDVPLQDSIEQSYYQQNLFQPLAGEMEEEDLLSTTELENSKLRIKGILGNIIDMLKYI